MNETGIDILRDLLFIIPHMMIVAACIYFLSKKITPEGVLLGVGSLISLLITIFHVVVLPYLHQKNPLEPFSSYVQFMTILGFISLLASLAFSIGFFILIYKVVEKKKTNSYQDLIDNH